MNLFKKLVELASMRLSLLSPRQMRFAISRKDWVDFGLVLIVSFLIVVYKVNKS
jgi:hypothetical protein